MPEAEWEVIYLPPGQFDKAKAIVEAAIEFVTGSMVPEEWMENKKRLSRAVGAYLEYERGRAKREQEG